MERQSEMTDKVELIMLLEERDSSNWQRRKRRMERIPRLLRRQAKGAYVCACPLAGTIAASHHSDIEKFTCLQWSALTGALWPFHQDEIRKVRACFCRRRGP